MDIAVNIINPAAMIEGVLLRNQFKGQLGGTRHRDTLRIMEVPGDPQYDTAGMRMRMRETISIYDLEWHYTPILMADGKDEFGNPKSFSVGDYVCLLARDPVPDWVWEQPGLVRFKNWPT